MCLHERVPPSQVDTARDWLHDNLLCYQVELVEFDPSMAADVLGPSRPLTYFLFDLVLVLVRLQHVFLRVTASSRGRRPQGRQHQARRARVR